MEERAADDEALMRAYGAGDATAFARLYDRHERPVYRFFLRQGVTTAQADDLLQDTWMAVVRSAPRYTVDAKFTTWLYRIARSKLIDHWRATRQQVLLDDAANDPDADGDEAPIDRIADADTVRPDVRAISRQQAAAFAAAVEALPAAQREALVLHLEGDLTMDEIARLTDVGAETAKSRLRYAMKRVRAACADWLAPPAGRTHAEAGRRDDT
jgi:RNA polymerase sigma-70 factor (ECF subfamily)